MTVITVRVELVLVVSEERLVTRIIGLTGDVKLELTAVMRGRQPPTFVP